MAICHHDGFVFGLCIGLLQIGWSVEDGLGEVSVL